MGKGTRRRPRRAGAAQKVRRHKVGAQGQADRLKKDAYPTYFKFTPDVERLSVLYNALREILLSFQFSLAEVFPDARTMKKWEKPDDPV